MRERLLNPKRLNFPLDSLAIVFFDGVPYRTFTEKHILIDDGMCQCYKDCDCSERKGKVTETSTVWYRNVAFDGTDKCFYSEPHTPPQYD